MATSEQAAAASRDGTRRGLIVDYGGVLTTSLFDSFSAFCELEGIEPAAVATAFVGDREARELLIEFECGRIDESVFEPALAAKLGVVDAARLVPRLMAGLHPEESMLAAVAAARAAGVRTGLLSNSWGTRFYDRELLARLFDGVVISGEVGIRKPSREIYELAAESVGLPPSSCVFVDDLPFNLDPARDLGMAVVHHTSAADTVAELERLLGVHLAGPHASV